MAVTQFGEILLNFEHKNVIFLFEDLLLNRAWWWYSTKLLAFIPTSSLCIWFMTPHSVLFCKFIFSKTCFEKNHAFNRFSLKIYDLTSPRSSLSHEVWWLSIQYWGKTQLATYQFFFEKMSSVQNSSLKSVVWNNFIVWKLIYCYFLKP